MAGSFRKHSGPSVPFQVLPKLGIEQFFELRPFLFGRSPGMERLGIRLCGGVYLLFRLRQLFESAGPLLSLICSLSSEANIWISFRLSLSIWSPSIASPLATAL